MKRFLITLSLIITVIFSCSLCGCAIINTSRKFFNKSDLEKHLVPDLPRFKGKNTDQQYSKVFTLETTEEYYEQYVKDVYEYLVSCNFAYLGYRGEVLETFFGATPTYEFFVGTELSDYRYNVDDSDYIEYVFVWANELYDDSTYDYDDTTLKSHFLEIRHSTSSNWMYVELCWSIQSYRLIDVDNE